MSEPAHSHIEILIAQGSREYARCLLQRGEYHIGQSAKNHIVVDEPSISSQHAVLFVHSEEEIYIRDCGSANGTYVEGEPAEEETAVGFRSKILIGACELYLRERPRF